MARVYSALLARGIMASGTSGVVYTVPADTVTVVKDVETVLASGTTGTHYSQLPGAVNWLVRTVTSDAPHDQWHGSMVLNAGDTITVYGITGGVNYVYSGYELVAPPP